MASKSDYISYAVYAILAFTILTFFRTCNNKGSIRDLEKQLEAVQVENQAKTDSIADLLLTEEEMTRLIKEVPAWNTLRIEEISDKEKISINALEQKEKNK